ncbi:MAG: zinc ribbon domain-containing protein [Candidatus Dependentiae bacterium]
MSETPLQLFVNLIQFDQSLLKIESSISVLNNQIQEAVHQKTQLQNQLEALKSRALLQRKKVDALELEMKHIDEKISRKKEQLDNVMGHREYLSLKAEIDNFKKQQHELEDSLISSWNDLENVQKELDNTILKVHEQLNLIQQEEHNKKVRIEELEKEFSLLAQQRAEKEKGIPEEWLEKYTAMRAKIADPVVPVVDKTCSGCAFLISDQDMLQLRHNKLVQCKSCFRLLYMTPH